MAPPQIGAMELFAKVRAQAVQIVELEMVRDALDRAFSEAQSRIVELEARHKDPEPGEVSDAT